MIDSRHGHVLLQIDVVGQRCRRMGSVPWRVP